MASGSTTLSVRTNVEDILEYLPVSATTEYRKGQRVYGPETAQSKSLYLVVGGTVGIFHVAEDSTELLLEVLRTDDIFGESAFLEVCPSSEQATALERATVMAWSISDMEDLILKRPRLAVALLQLLAQRNADFTRRIESLANDCIERRLARTLIRFSERLGLPEEDGSVRMMPFTHALLSQYVGTSREIVTHYMNDFRRKGYVGYSRDGIRLHRNSLNTVFSDNSSRSAGSCS